MSHERRHPIFRYEHHSEPVLSRPLFLWRLLFHALLALGLIAVSLGIGVLGYRFVAGLSWIDALMNASMILGGRPDSGGASSPVAALRTSEGRPVKSASLQMIC